MWVAVHGFTGMALGVWSPLGLGLTIVAAIVLHLLLDLVPHWDYTRHRRRVLWAALDVGVTAIAFLAAGFTLTDGLSVAVVGFVSALPDLDVFDAIKPRSKRRRWFPSHWSRFPHGTASPALGIPLQVVIMVASLTAIAAGAG